MNDSLTNSPSLAHIKRRTTRASSLMDGVGGFFMDAFTAATSTVVGGGSGGGGGGGSSTPSYYNSHILNYDYSNLEQLERDARGGTTSGAGKEKEEEGGNATGGSRRLFSPLGFHSDDEGHNHHDSEEEVEEESLMAGIPTRRGSAAVAAATVGEDLVLGDLAHGYSNASNNNTRNRNRFGGSEEENNNSNNSHIRSGYRFGDAAPPETDSRNNNNNNNSAAAGANRHHYDETTPSLRRRPTEVFTAEWEGGRSSTCIAGGGAPLVELMDIRGVEETPSVTPLLMSPTTPALTPLPAHHHHNGNIHNNNNHKKGRSGGKNRRRGRGNSMAISSATTMAGSHHHNHYNNNNASVTTATPMRQGTATQHATAMGHSTALSPANHHLSFFSGSSAAASPASYSLPFSNITSVNSGGSPNMNMNMHGRPVTVAVASRKRGDSMLLSPMNNSLFNSPKVMRGRGGSLTVVPNGSMRDHHHTHNHHQRAVAGGDSVLSRSLCVDGGSSPFAGGAGGGGGLPSPQQGSLLLNSSMSTILREGRRVIMGGGGGGGNASVTATAEGHSLLSPMNASLSTSMIGAGGGSPKLMRRRGGSLIAVPNSSMTHYPLGGGNASVTSRALLEEVVAEEAQRQKKRSDSIIILNNKRKQRIEEGRRRAAHRRGLPCLITAIIAVMVTGTILLLCTTTTQNDDASANPTPSPFLLLMPLQISNAQSSSQSSTPIALNGIFPYSSGPSLFPSITYLDASATIVTTTVAPTTTTTATTTTTPTTTTTTVTSTTATTTTPLTTATTTTEETPEESSVVSETPTGAADNDTTTSTYAPPLPSNETLPTGDADDDNTTTTTTANGTTMDDNTNNTIDDGTIVINETDTTLPSASGEAATETDTAEAEGGGEGGETTATGTDVDQLQGLAVVVGGGGARRNFQPYADDPSNATTPPPTTATTTTTTRMTTAAPTASWVDYCTTPDAQAQLSGLCTTVFGVTGGVSGFGTTQVQWSWGVASDGVSRGATLVNALMYPSKGNVTARWCRSVLETSATDPTFRYVSQIQFNCGCNIPDSIGIVDGSGGGVVGGSGVNATSFLSLPPVSGSSVNPGATTAFIPPFVPASVGANIPMTIDTRQAAISKNPNTMTVTWLTGFQSSPRGQYCEPRTGKCPDTTMIRELFHNAVAAYREEGRDRSTLLGTNPVATIAGGIFGCQFLGQYPYLFPLQNYFQDCTPRTLVCSSNNYTVDENGVEEEANEPSNATDPTNGGDEQNNNPTSTDGSEGSTVPTTSTTSSATTASVNRGRNIYNISKLTFSCPLCRGGTQAITMMIVTYYKPKANPTTGTYSANVENSDDFEVAYDLINCTSKFFAPTVRSCDTVYLDCNGNGCCRTEENTASGGLTAGGTASCACFDNNVEGHYVGSACERCSSRYTFCTEGGCAGGASGIPYYTCIVDQQQLVALLADLSTSGMAMTMPLLIMLGVFIIIGLIRSSWESDQEFEFTRLRRGGIDVVSGKLASLPEVGISEVTRHRLHLAIDRKIVPDRPSYSTGMLARRKRAAMAGLPPIDQ